MIVAALVIFILIASVALFMQQPSFGKIPKGAGLEQIKKSINYKDGKFQNLTFTPALKEGIGYFTVIRKFFFSKSKEASLLSPFLL